MQAKDAILQSLDISEMIMGKYLEDLKDEDFFIKPVEGMNSIAWQVGHLISSERGMIEGVKPGSCPPLPEGFDAKHDKEAAKIDDPSRFHTKAEYLATWKAQRAATRAVLESMADADLDAPPPERFRQMCSNVGKVFNLTGLHALMHVGQFVAVRRERKMPIAF